MLSLLRGVRFGTTSQPVLAAADRPGSLSLAAGAPSRKITLPVLDSPLLPAVPALPGHIGQRRPSRNAAGNGRVEPQQAGAEANCQTRAGAGFLRAAGTAQSSHRGIALNSRLRRCSAVRSRGNSLCTRHPAFLSPASFLLSRLTRVRCSQAACCSLFSTESRTENWRPCRTGHTGASQRSVAASRRPRVL